MKTTTLILLSFFALFGHGQEKKKIDHTVYDDWKSISAVKQSKTGIIISYEINPQVGDGFLHIETLDGDNTRVFSRGKKAKIGYNETFVAFLIKPEFDTIRALKLAEEKKDKFPKDTLAIYFPLSDSLHTVPEVESFDLSSEGDWIAYLSQKDEREECPKKKCKLFKKKCNNPKTSGTTLHLINPITGKEKTVDLVVEYHLDKKGNKLAYTTSYKGNTDTLTVRMLDLNTMEDHILITDQLKIRKLQFDYVNEQLVILHSADTNKRKTYRLSYWKNGMEKATVLIDSVTKGMPENFTISEYSPLYFSRNGENLFFGINKDVVQDPEDTLLDSEKAKVDVWSGFDPKIQPQQIAEKKRTERKTFLSIYNFSTEKLIQIEDDTIDFIRKTNHSNGSFAIGYSSIAYQKSTTWAFPWKRDLYLIDLETGERNNLKTGQAYSSILSPSEEYFLWYEGADSNWYAQSIKTKSIVNLTEEFDAEFAQDINGFPYIPYSEGNSGWTLIDGKEYYIINSQYDVWAVCPSDKTLSFRLTETAGKIDKTKYRFTRFDTDSTYTVIENNLMHSVSFKTKQEAYYQINLEEKSTILQEVIHSDHSFLFVNKSAESDQILFRRSSFEVYPELESSTMNFSNIKTLTDANPQQKEYNWGTVDLVDWTSFEGRKLRGLLYKPEDFDSSKSYPLIVYYYEKSTHAYHRYYSPRPTPSIVYPTEYTSNGYIMFMPDIEYTAGHPAASAYDCIVSGTDFLTNTYSYIDSTRMGLQGQSWGGYQTAQLITMTTKYKAAMAGAPVSNMFSAYGGVRWTSGMSRMFQYERGQSRIGYTIWEKPNLYIENSPIFGLPNVKTPLLIMHNDGDGSVPWYQGVELYMGLRRLDQPVWLLNYNGDQHNLMIRANRLDLSIRMKQFFDYYLLGADIPLWMQNGVPAIEKGINYGLELKKNDN